MDKSKLPIGIFDSGVGGLTVVNKLRMLLPHENIIYVGDTKRNPYGSRTAAEILSYTRDILRFMSAQSVKLVAIGCNTVTATVYPQLMQEVPYPLIGMSKGIKTAQKISAGGTIAVFATELTIAPPRAQYNSNDINLGPCRLATIKTILRGYAPGNHFV